MCSSDLDEAALFKHGTTLVINTLLERSGPAIALVTTRGFRDVLELGRGNRTETFNLNFRREPPLVPRARRFELDERMDAAGQTVRRPRIEDLAEVAGRIRESGAVAVAVSFLNAYLNPAHERQVCDWLRERLPGCFVTAGTDLTREWYEYERTATAAANAYAGPQIGSYVARLESALREHRFAGQLLLMGSNGGVLSADEVLARSGGRDRDGSAAAANFELAQHFERAEIGRAHV